jgi:plasmid stability protein
MYITCEHVIHMSKMIQIRNVPESLHREAKARAAREGLTLSDYAKRALEREVGRVSVDELWARIRELAPVEGDIDAAALIREERDRA